jgi:hypothetical protein
MKFLTQSFNKIDGYRLGVEVDSGALFLSISVGNAMVDYDEYYKLTQTQFDQFKLNESMAAQFASQCRNRKMDFLLILLPGSDRGTPL